MKRRPRRSFTLVEILVTVGVIVFLVGLSVTGISALTARSEIRYTENQLRLLDLAMQEWELASDRKLTRGPGQELEPDTPFMFVISEVLTVIGRNPRAREALAQLDPADLYVYESGKYPRWIAPGERPVQEARFIGAMAVLDAWGIPIYATHPGPVDPDHPAQDPDGTIHTYNESYFGSARNRRVCFVSAGPDGAFGSVSAQPGSEMHDKTLDNIYSYPIDRPQ